MIPVIGIVQVGAQSMADRYTYVPFFGLFVMLVWGAAEFVPRLKLNAASTAVVAAIPIIVLSIVAFNQTSLWKDSITLYTHTLNAGQGHEAGSDADGRRCRARCHALCRVSGLPRRRG
jgi:hypothetical protein